MTTEIFILLVIYQLKHFMADFPLQTEFMLGKFKAEGWQKPLAAHAGVHAGMTFVISIFFTSHVSLWFGLALFDFVVHFGMDRVKASPNLLGKYQALTKRDFEEYLKGLSSFDNSLEDYPNPNDPLHYRLKQGRSDYIEAFDKRKKGNKLFWWSLGLDQAVHHLTHYVIIAVLTIL